jgi:hypothetical protein
MAYRQPKRSGKCPRCQSRGQCSCQRRDNAEAARNPAALTTCSRMCGWNGKGKSCGRQARNGYCPCPNC